MRIIRLDSRLLVATVLCLFAGLDCLRATEATPLTLIENGKASVAIVVPVGDLPSSKATTTRKQVRAHSVAVAARELADYLQKATGAQVRIQSEQAKPEGEKPAVRIFLGTCEANRKLVAGKPLDAEEFVIRTEPGKLHIIGGDKTKQGDDVNGTLNAVYTFLEDYIGVRWLLPGDLGEVVPRTNTLALPAIDRREQPRIAKRKIRDVALSRESTYAPVLKQWGVSVDEWRRAFDPEINSPWFRRQKLGSRIEIEGGHSYAGWWEKYGKDHPNFFAMQPDGTRVQEPNRERLCVSNPKLWDFVAKLRIEELKADNKPTASISPNDGGKNKFCMCAQCRAWDPPNAPKLTNSTSLIDPTTGKPFAEYPSLSDREFRYFNEVAKRVHAELPDRYVVAYAYSVYRTPPVNIKTLEPNLIVGYVGLDLTAIDQWSRLAPQLFIRPNDLGPGTDLGMPRNMAPFLARAVKFSVDHHAIAFDFDNCHGNWGGHGLDYYVLTKALWNPDLDVRAAIADYCRAAYGPGADAMQRYFGRLEKITEAVRANEKLGARSGETLNLLRHYTPAALAELDSLLGEAKRAIGNTDTKALARVAMAEDGMQYAHLITALLEAAKQPKARKSPLYKERMQAVEDFLKAKVLTQSIASLHSHRYLRTALSYSVREEE